MTLKEDRIAEQKNKYQSVFVRKQNHGVYGFATYGYDI